jgi:opacity protein-like surface antigen
MIVVIIRFIIYIYVCLAASISFSIDSPSQEESKFLPYNYVKIKSGSAIPTSLDGNTGLNTGKTTYTVGLAAGRKIDEFISLDAEYMFRGNSTAQYYQPGQIKNGSTSWTIKSYTFMLNASVDLIHFSRITPYVIAGGGLAVNKASDYSLYTDDDEPTVSTYPGKTTRNFAWQLGCGVNFYGNKNYSTGIEYVFINRGTAKTKSYMINPNGTTTSVTPINGDVQDHVITVGLKIKF